MNLLRTLYECNLQKKDLWDPERCLARSPPTGALKPTLGSVSQCTATQETWKYDEIWNILIFSKFVRFVCVRYVVILKNRHLQHLLSKAIAAKPTFSTMATRSMRPVLLPLALLAAIAAPAFTGMSRATPRTRIPRAADNFIPLDAIEPAVSSYVFFIFFYVYLGLHSESQLSKFLRKILRKRIDEVSMFFIRSLWPF